jgi:hypothetical protein
LLSLSSDLAHDLLLSLFDLAMPAHSKAKLTSAARKIIPLIDLLFKDKDIKVNEVVEFIENNYCLRYLGNSDTGLERAGSIPRFLPSFHRPSHQHDWNDQDLEGFQGL